MASWGFVKVAMAKRSEVLNKDYLSGLIRHHPYLQILQKEDWQEYLMVLGQIYDVLEEHSSRVSMDSIRPLVHRFYTQLGHSTPESKATTFFTMAIAELQVLKDSHDQFGQRYLETTRSGKSLLQMFEGLIQQRSKFSGTGAEVLLSALNDILISRRQMTEDEALQHHREKIAAYKEDIARIKSEGLAAAQLLPIAHSNEALFSQAEEASIHVLNSIEEVKSAIETQRKESASSHFTNSRSSGQTLSMVADFYQRLYQSPAYTSYVTAKDLLSHLEGFQAHFSLRNVDRLLHSIEDRGILPPDVIKRSNLSAFMRQFAVADDSIQDKIKEQLRILQQQVLYSTTTDVQGMGSALKEILSAMLKRPTVVLSFFEQNPIEVLTPVEFDFGPVEICDFELPAEAVAVELTEEAFDREQERELLLALAQAEEGTLRDILYRLEEHLRTYKELRASDHRFPRGLAEYYILSEIELFTENFQKRDLGCEDLIIDSKHGSFVLRQVSDFVLSRKSEGENGPN